MLSTDGYYQYNKVASEYDAQNEEIGDRNHGNEFVTSQKKEGSHR